jgi:DNA-binding ferritin-like protein (Dps family)
LEGVLGLFEEGAKNGRGVWRSPELMLPAFCDELLINAKTYTEDWRKKLNTEIMEKLGRDIKEK